MNITKGNPAGWRVVDDSGSVTYFGEFGNYATDSTRQAVIYKDWKAFRENNGICYIPECNFTGPLDSISMKKKSINLTNSKFYSTSDKGYTRQDLMRISRDVMMTLEQFFVSLDGRTPEELAEPNDIFV